jgi:hypothetical protein
MVPVSHRQPPLARSTVTRQPGTTPPVPAAAKHLRLVPARLGREQSSDRRRFPRVPFSGAMRWRSCGRTGIAQVLDLSEAGAAFTVSQHDAAVLGDRLDLDIIFGANVTWQVTRGAHVTKLMPGGAGTCRVGVAFPPGQLNGAP